MTQNRQQVPRGTMADAEERDKMYLIKNVKALRATYQIRLLAYKAVTKGLTLVLVVPSACAFHPSLLDLIGNTGHAIHREDY